MNIRRIISFLVVLLAAVNIECQAYVKYVTTGLNLRYGPGTEYSVITVIPRGTAVTIDEDCDCKWVPVEYNGLIGYISTKYLSSNPQYIQTYTNQKNKYHQSSHTVEVFDIIRTLMEIGFSHQHIIRLHLQGQPHCVVMELTALVKVVEELAHIMVEWQDGCK